MAEAVAEVVVIKAVVTIVIIIIAAILVVAVQLFNVMAYYKTVNLLCIQMENLKNHFKVKLSFSQKYFFQQFLISRYLTFYL